MIRGAVLAAFFVAGAVPLAAQAVTPAPLREGTVAFAMRATTVNDFTGHVGITRAVFQGTDVATVTGTVEVQVAEMRTGIGLRDRHMRNAMRADSFPVVRFELAGVEVGATRGDTIAVAYRGSLTIHGVTRTVRVPGWIIVHQPGAEVHAEFPLDMREYGIDPPTRFLGAVKVDPVVGLTVHLVFGDWMVGVQVPGTDDPDTRHPTPVTPKNSPGAFAPGLSSRATPPSDAARDHISEAGILAAPQGQVDRRPQLGGSRPTDPVRKARHQDLCYDACRPATPDPDPLDPLRHRSLLYTWLDVGPA